ncbi:MAG: hypothetical protein E7420_00655 [Ruminococcaceae bacterium]|nr:hypothetical protein [Oscillospiraceae bacterium]
MDKRTNAAPTPKPTKKALSDASRQNAVTATHTMGIDIKKNVNEMLSLSIDAQVISTKSIPIDHINPKKTAYQNGMDYDLLCRV